MLASPPGALYRARKFLRRHRPAVFGSGRDIRERSRSPRSHRDSPSETQRPDKVTIVLGDFANTTGDPVFDGTLRQMMAVELGQVSVPQRAFGCAHERDTAPDGPARGCEAHPGCCVRNLRADRQCSSRGGLDCTPWKSVRVGLARKELPNRRYPGRRAGASSQKRGRLQGAGPNGKPFRDRAGESAASRGKGAQSAGRSNDTLTRGLEVLQRGNEGVPGESTVSGSRLTPEARHRGRPEICDGLCHPRPRACRPRGDRTCGGECSQGVRAAGWCQRSGEITSSRSPITGR